MTPALVRHLTEHESMVLADRLYYGAYYPLRVASVNGSLHLIRIGNDGAMSEDYGSLVSILGRYLTGIEDRKKRNNFLRGWNLALNERPLDKATWLIAADEIEEKSIHPQAVEVAEKIRKEIYLLEVTA